MWRRIVCLLLCGAISVWPVAADGGQVLYDEGAGESLDSLLAEDETVWSAMAVPTDAEGLDIRAKGAVLMDLGSGTVLYEQKAQ